MLKKLVAVERLNLTPNANEEFAKRAEEYIFYDDIPSSEEEVIQRAKDADGILVNITTQITANIIQHCPNLRYIGMCCSLYDENSASVDIRCARERGITVLGVRDYGDIGVGEYVISQLTDLLHGFHGKRWGDRPLELTGIPVGIIGMGATGQYTTARTAASRKCWEPSRNSQASTPTASLSVPVRLTCSPKATTSIASTPSGPSRRSSRLCRSLPNR